MNYGKYSVSILKKDTIVEMQVVYTDKKSVYLDYGGRSEARISSLEFDSLPNIGERFSVYVVDTDANDSGDPVVSKRMADFFTQQEALRDLMNKQENASGVVKKIEDNGVAVIQYKTVKGLIRFPKSEISKMSQYLDKTVNFSITTVYDFMDSKGVAFLGYKTKVISREEQQAYDAICQRYSEGSLIEGRVSSIKTFGAFIDVGGIDAILYNKDLSYGKNKTASEMLREGEKITVRILELKNNGRILVGLKQVKPDPWTQFDKEVSIGDEMEGIVTAITPYGAFINLREGVDGLLHISDISWNKAINSPEEVLSLGQKIKLIVIGKDIKAKKVTLSLKHLSPSPWDKFTQTHKIGSEVTGVIKSITSCGIFIEIEPGINALLCQRDLPQKHEFTLNETIVTRIANIDEDTCKIRVKL